jgi:hypothetical protein
VDTSAFHRTNVESKRLTRKQKKMRFMYFIKILLLITRRVLAQNFVVLRETGDREKSFRAQSLHYVDAGGACRREHRSDYRRA